MTHDVCLRIDINILTLMAKKALQCLVRPGKAESGRLRFFVFFFVIKKMVEKWIFRLILIFNN